MTIYRAVTPDSMCMTCLRKGHHAPTCEDQTSQWEIVRRTLVAPTDAYPAQAPEMAAEPRTARAPVPVWPVVLVVLGLVLMAIGLVFRDPVALWVWHQIHG